MLCFAIAALSCFVQSVGAGGLSPPLVFHAAFDGTIQASARGDGAPVQVDGPVAYRPGKFGQALVCGEGGASLQYRTVGNLRASSGTVEMWVCPLDWTGAEEEFHVFLEAQTPGWLVLYRYYQGGITALAGTDGAHYAAAMGPAIRWKPGEWRHIAATWRARRLEVYVDGERVGTADSARAPQELASVFHLGDRPWHVPRKRQTLIDEVRIYSAPLDAESIARSAKGLPIVWKPRALLDYTVDPAADILSCRIDAAGLVGDAGSVRSARVEVGSAGGTALRTADIRSFAREVESVGVSVAGLPPGDYEIRSILLDGGGGEVLRTSARFEKPEPPVWRGNRLGTADRVLRPFTPLRVDRARSAVSCWGRRYEFGSMLSAAASIGAPLLSRPVRLEAVTRGRVVALTGPPARVVRASPTHTVLTGVARGAGLTAALQHVVEFDGFIWTDVKVTAAAPVEVDELRIAWAMPRTQATLLHADRMAWLNNPAGSLGTEGWRSPFAPCFWVGNEDRGLSWYAESSRDWVVSPTLPAIELKPVGGEVTATVRLIAARTSLRGARSYGFGHMATPTRPRPANAMALRMAPSNRTTLDVVWPNGNMKYYGHTEPIDPAKFRERVAAAHRRKWLCLPYVNLNYVSAGVPEWNYHQSAWADVDRVVTPSDVAEMGYASCGACPNRRDWQDFILWRIGEMIDRYGVDGIYIDCWGPMPCRCTACGWTDDAGKRQPTHPIRAYRAILRRVCTLFQERKPSAHLMLHLSSEMNAPLISLADTVVDGEQFGTSKLTDDYLAVMPADMVRAEMLGRNHGPVTFFLPEFRGDYSPAGTANLAAYLLAHGLNPWPIWSHAATWTTLYDALDAIGFDQARFMPYWKAADWATRPEHLLSAYVSRDATVLAIVNTADAPRDVRLPIDARRWNMGSVSGATDLIRGDTHSVRDGVLSIPLAAHQGRVLRLRP